MDGIRVWLYCRAASKEKSKEILWTQKRKLERCAKRHNFKIVGCSSDIGGGLTLDRQGLLEFHIAMEEGQVDILLLQNLFRLGQDLDAIFQYWQVLREHNVRLCTVTNGEISLDIDPILSGIFPGIQEGR